MELSVDQKQISIDEKNQISKQVKADLIEHLYQGCLPGTISGMIASIGLFLDYYGYTPTDLLIAWNIFFNLMMLSLTGLYFIYTRNKAKYSLNTWELAYGSVMIGCAISWVPAIYLLPMDSARQYLALLAIFMATTGYATGTIGQFKLCLGTLAIIFAPLIAWCFYKGGLFYNIIGSFAFIYMSFMFGINHRSTQWFKDSLKLKLENTLVSYQANHDLLTNLPNQRLLPQYLEAAILLSREVHQAFALICFSLNRMEVINDSFGHQAGDTIIQAVAMRLNQLSDQLNKEKDNRRCILTISRKDTFNIIVTGIEPEKIDLLIKDFFNLLDEPFYIEKKGLKITASIGACVYPIDGADPQALLINADAAMLKAKQFGGNRFELYRSEITAQLPRQLELETDLHEAIKSKQLQVFYQPLVNLQTGTIAGMEALLRWPHPVHGFISPANFIPLAEETGLIVPIGEWVLEEACAKTYIWHQMGFKHLKVAVNLSEKQLREKMIIETIKRVLAKTHFDPHFLELELTETGFLDEHVTPIIQEFKAMHLSLAVDDFGTGYSGLSYLKRFAIDKLKIDQSFVRDIPNSSDSIAIVSAILAMAKELKVRTLAEGVETKEQLNFLKEKKCDFIQGYYYSKPINADAFTELLLSHRTLADCEIEKIECLKEK